MVNDLIVVAFSIQAEKLLCPVCSVDEPCQPMCAFGDWPETLFCPHCGLMITFSQPTLDKPGGKNDLWVECCLKKFIERFKK